jgi:hypothetical protein
MKLLKSILFSITTLLGCTSKKNLSIKDSDKLAIQQEADKMREIIESFGKLTKRIDFKIKADEEEIELEIDDDGFINWISVEHPELERLISPDEIVITRNSVRLYIDYPLNYPVFFDLKSKENGFTRKELAEQISKKYHLIYSEEEESANNKTIPQEQRKIMNRNPTDGKYGVWGHDIIDLDLTAIEVYEDKNKKLTLLLIIES